MYLNHGTLKIPNFDAAEILYDNDILKKCIFYRKRALKIDAWKYKTCKCGTSTTTKIIFYGSLLFIETIIYCKAVNKPNNSIASEEELGSNSEK